VDLDKNIGKGLSNRSWRLR